jgi:hypothetical protein
MQVQRSADSGDLECGGPAVLDGASGSGQRDGAGADGVLELGLGVRHVDGVFGTHNLDADRSQLGQYSLGRRNVSVATRGLIKPFVRFIGQTLIDLGLESYWERPSWSSTTC